MGVTVPTQLMWCWDARRCEQANRESGDDGDYRWCQRPLMDEVVLNNTNMRIMMAVQHVQHAKELTTEVLIH